MNVTEKDTLRFVNMLEQDYAVTEWTISGIKVWPIIRLDIGEEFYASHANVCITDTKSNTYLKKIRKLLCEIKSFLKIYFYDYKNNCEYNDEDIICIIGNESRWIRDGKLGWYSRTVEPIRSQLTKAGFSVFNFEYFNSSYFLNGEAARIPRNNKSKIVNMGIIKSIIMSKFQSVYDKNVYLPDYEVVSKLCLKRGINLESFDYVYLVQLLLATRDYYINILKKGNPKLVIITNWRNMKEMALTMAAKKLGIPCIEVAHGYYGQESFTHFGWKIQPKNGYELRPDFYWCWTNKSAEYMNKELIKGKAIAGYPPHIHAWFNGIKNNYLDEEKILKKILPQNKKIILVTLNHVISREKYPSWLLDVVHDTKNEFFWLFRKHDNIKRSGQDILCDEIGNLSNVEWEKSSLFPLMLLLENSDIHITYDSSSVIEAAFMGLHSIVMSEMCRDRYMEQFENGEVSFVKSYDEMMNILVNYSDKTNKELVNDYAIEEMISIMKK